MNPSRCTLPPVCLALIIFQAGLHAADQPRIRTVDLAERIEGGVIVEPSPDIAKTEANLVKLRESLAPVKARQAQLERASRDASLTPENRSAAKGLWTIAQNEIANITAGIERETKLVEQAKQEAQSAARLKQASEIAAALAKRATIEHLDLLLDLSGATGTTLPAVIYADRELRLGQPAGSDIPTVKLVTINLLDAFNSHPDHAAFEARAKELSAIANTKKTELDAGLAAASREQQALRDQMEKAATEAERYALLKDLPAKTAAVDTAREHVASYTKEAVAGWEAEKKATVARLMEKIVAAATADARKAGGNLLLDVSGVTSIGISSIVYSSPKLDVIAVRAGGEAQPLKRVATISLSALFERYAKGAAEGKSREQFVKLLRAAASDYATSRQIDLILAVEGNTMNGVPFIISAADKLDISHDIQL